jgi:hypothetical protein
MKIRTTAWMTGLIALALLLGACGPGTPEPTPTLGPEAIQTITVATFSSVLTQTALFAPTITPTSTATATLALASPTLSTGVTSIPTVACYRLSYAADVSIPDNTPMTPGQTFTKTWKVRNTGTCAWDAGFKFAFTSGNAMGGVTYTLPQSVASNAEIDISIAMTAPNTTGTLKGNWRMSTAAGAYFGDEVYVQIVVGGTAATASITATPSATPTVTPTSTNTQ